MLLVAQRKSTMFATVSSKSRITLPKALQQWLGVQKGDKLQFILEQGGARMQKVTGVSFDSLLGLLPPPSIAHNVEEMNRAISQALAEKHQAPKQRSRRAA